MKKILLSSILCMMGIISSAQTVVISDNFDSYTAGAQLAATSPLWITWTGVPSEDAPVSSAQSSSAPNSVYIMGNNGPGDIVFQFPANYISGVYELTFKIFIAANKGAYFNMQSSIIPAVDWMLEVYFDNAGGGYIHAGGPNAAFFTYNLNLWNDIKVKADLTGDEAEFYINNILVYTWAWSLASDGMGAPISWGGMNLYASAAPPGDAEYYVDDVVLSNVTPTGLSDDISLSGFRIFPNPATENPEVIYTSARNISGMVQILNPVGEIIYEEPKEFMAGRNRLRISNTLSSGMYLLRLVTKERIFSEKFIVEK